MSSKQSGISDKQEDSEENTENTTSNSDSSDQIEMKLVPSEEKSPCSFSSQTQATTGILRRHMDDIISSSEVVVNDRLDSGGVSSVAYGGARPKTTKSHDKNRFKNGENRNRTIDNTGLDLKVSCDTTEYFLDPGLKLLSEDMKNKLPFSEISQLPKLESRQTYNGERAKRLSNTSDIARDDNGESEQQLEEDCYIYTYKGGTAYLTADLPNSFFRLDSGSDGESLPGVAGAGQSNLSTGVAALIQDQLINSPQVRSFSPEQDFIEMDFDPGTESDDDSSGDSGQGMDGTDMEGEERETFDATPRSSHNDGGVRESLSTPEAQQNISIEPINVSNNNTLPNDEKINISEAEVASVCPSTLLDPNFQQEIQEPLHTSSAPALSPAEDVPVMIPRSKSLNSSLGDCLMLNSEPPIRTANLSLCGSRLLQREAIIFSGEEEVDTNSNILDSVGQELTPSLYKLSCSERLQPSGTQKAMIWTEKEAIRKQITQLPNTSSCGAVALLNVLLALDVDINQQSVAEAVHTKLRRLDAPLADYLLSRSMAGCTHLDLLSAVENSVPAVKARFFQFHNRSFQLASWLVNWVSRGMVPVLTLNVQKSRNNPDGFVQDSWHHQMVWGVSGQDVYLANPLQMIHERSLTEQISSPSELLIRRVDIVSRFHSSLDLSEINRLGQRWQDMNVLGQVVNVIREENSAMKEENTSLTSHVKIPASYISGVTIFCHIENDEGCRLLMESPDLPILTK